MGRSILVTGGAGYIGSHAVLALLERGFEVYVVDDLSTGHAALVDKRAHFVEAGIADTVRVDQLIRDAGIDSVMHFAGSIIVSESMADPIKYYRTNVAGSIELIRTAVDAGVKHFVFSSSAAVYGRAERVPISETDPCQPINPYGWSKLIIEKMLEDVAKVSSISFAALRYFNVAGADTARRSGQISKVSTHLIKVGVEAALGKRDKIEIFGSDYDTADGTAVRDYVHVSDLADVHVLALEWLHAHPGENLTLNCGYGKGYSVAEVLEAVNRHSHRKLNVVRADRRAGDPDALVASNARVLERLDWKPRFASLDQMINDAIEWERLL
jgi:UDP-glucose 4-epimerase